MNRVYLIRTTNSKFKYLEGTEEKMDDFHIGGVIYYGDFHTSNIQNIKYDYFEDTVSLLVTTLNSEYVFEIRR